MAQQGRTTVTVTLPTGEVVTHTSARTVTHALIVQVPGEDRFAVFSWHGSRSAALAGRAAARQCGCDADTARIVPTN